MLRKKCFKLTIALIVLMGTSIVSSGQKVLVEKLPQVEDFTATFLDKPTKSGNVVLSLKFSEKTQLPENFSIQLDKRRLVEFSDAGEKNDLNKGDGVFTGLAFFKESEILTPQMKKGGTFPIFNGRQFVGYKEFPPVNAVTPNVPINVNSAGNPANIDSERSLLVRHPKVVQDPSRTRTSCDEGSMGKWSFGYLMTEMANEAGTGINPADFTMAWLKNWMEDQTVNTWTVGERRYGMEPLIEKWKKDGEGRLDLSMAPFRLLAIVNRADLRGGFVYGQESSDNAGELRFVFGLVDQETCEAQSFTVILEYGVSKKSCPETQEWGVSWKKLDNYDLGSPEYNEALEHLTEQVVVAGAGGDRKPNGSAINQVRTNDFVLDRPWELREFQFARDNDGFLHEATIKQTPDRSLNGTKLLATFINQFQSDILAGTHVVPENYLGQSFLGGAIEYDSSDFWNARGIVNNNARHQFSVSTCNSCHGRESYTKFLHVTPVNYGPIDVPLSGFLRGNTDDTSDVEFLSVQDPVVGSVSRDFNDLLRRAADLDALINTPCGRQFAVTSATTMTH